MIRYVTVLTSRTIFKCTLKGMNFSHVVVHPSGRPSMELIAELELGPLKATPHSPPLSPWQPPSCFLSMNLTSRGASSKGNHPVFIFLRWGSVLQLHQCGSVCPDFLFNVKDIPLLEHPSCLIPSSTGGHLGCLQLLAPMGNAAGSTAVQIPLPHPAFSAFEETPEEELPNPMVVLY